jgi:hypothetical protein
MMKMRMEDFALFSGQFKGKCRNCGVIGHKARDCKNRTQQNVGNHKNLQNGASVLIVEDPAITRQQQQQ